MKKQIATTLIAASMLASLCSCGNNTAAGTTAAETQAAETTAAQTEETAAETTVKETTAATTTTAAETTAATTTTVEETTEKELEEVPEEVIFPEIEVIESIEPIEVEIGGGLYAENWVDENGVSYILVNSASLPKENIDAINETLKKCEPEYREFLASLEVGEGIFMPGDFERIYSVGNYMILNTDVFATEPWDAVIDLDTGKFLEPQDLLGDNWHDMLDEKYQSVEFDKAWISNYYGNDEIGYFALVTLFKNGQTTYPVQASIDMPKE